MAETADTQKLIALIEANTKSYERAMARLEGVTRSAMKKASDETTKLQKALNQAGAAATTFVRGLAVGAIAGAVTGIAAVAKSAITTAAALQDVSENTGIAADQLQMLAIAAEQSGGNAESLLASFRKFNVEIGEARNKGGDLADLLKANGISLQQDNLAIWRQIVDMIANAKDETDAAYIAQLAMGRSAAENLNFFRQGSAEISRIGQVAKDAGAVVDKELIAKADEFVDRWNLAWNTMTAQITGWAIKAIASIESVISTVENSSIWKFMHRNEGKGYWGDWSTGGGVIAGGGAGSAASILGAGAKKPPVIPSGNDKEVKDFGRQLDVTMVKVKAVKTETEKWMETFKEGLDGIGSTLMGVARGTESLGDALTRTVQRIQDMFADKAFNMLINALFAYMGAPPDPFAGINPNPGAFGGRRAAGGPMQAGKGYLVGEQGPEWVVPDRSSYVVPNGRSGGGGGSQIHMHFEQGITADQQKTQTSQGERVDIMIKRMVRQEIVSAMKPTMRDQYGIHPAMRRRF